MSERRQFGFGQNEMSGRISMQFTHLVKFSIIFANFSSHVIAHSRL